MINLLIVSVSLWIERKVGVQGTIWSGHLRGAMRHFLRRTVKPETGATTFAPDTPFSYLSLAIVAALISGIGPAEAGGLPAGIDIVGGKRSMIYYDCGTAPSRFVVYINAGADRLAIVPIAGRRRIFVNVISASGARYASGRFVWWTKGASASLYDRMRGPDAGPFANCRARDP